MVWIQSTLGAFSIVLADPASDGEVRDPDTVMVRTRIRKHLELLLRAHPKLTDYPISESGPGHDYRWQIVAPKSLVAAIVAKLVLGIDYRSLKEACAAARPELDSGYISALQEVRGVLRGMQNNAS